MGSSMSPSIKCVVYTRGLSAWSGQGSLEVQNEGLSRFDFQRGVRGRTYLEVCITGSYMSYSKQKMVAVYFVCSETGLVLL